MVKTVLLVASMATAMLLAYAGVLVVLGEHEASAQTTPKPNIVFVLTDDLDAGSIRYMPTVQRELVQKGTTFENGILTLTQCCPSRATMLRGQYAHNHRIGFGVEPSARSFKKRGLEKSTVATWLHEAGYKTALFGKYLNGYDYRYVPPGWDQWHASVGADVWPECLNDNGTKRCYGGQHPDAVLDEKAEGFVRSSRGGTQPLFLWLAFNAPHEPAPYMRQDRNKFSGLALPKSPSFNERDVSDKPAWIRNRPLLNGKQIKATRRLYLDRLRSLQAVDRAVGHLLDALDDTGRLENTYIVFWTDNGFHMGEHRLAPLKGTSGKSAPYLEDTKVPLIVRGPDVPQAKREELVLNTDIAPTFAALGGAQPDDFVDGRSFAPLLEGEAPGWRTTALIENRRSTKPPRPAYAGLITESAASEDTAYIEYEGGGRELYDLEDDPYQLENAFAQNPPPDRALVSGLEDQLDKLRGCKATACKDAEN
jgi:arylsulfatase A-like enzyme